MIIFITGTNGSGKTTLMRRVMEEILRGDPEILENNMGLRWPGVTVIGRYKGACGGCDRLSWKGASDDMEKVVTSEAEAGQTVLLEGLIVANWGIARFGRLSKFGVHCVHLSLPVEECIASVNERRLAKSKVTGKEYTPTKEHNIRGKFNTLINNIKRRREMDIPVYELSRADAFGKIGDLLQCK